MPDANPSSRLRTNLDEARKVFAALDALEAPVEQAARMLGDALLGGHKLLACGNGGSAADAMHMTTEFVCRFVTDRRPFPAISLTAHGGDMTAIGNDYAFEDLFERQVRAFGQPGDVLVGLTTSGNSENVRRALVAAGEIGVHTIACSGVTAARPEASRKSSCSCRMRTPPARRRPTSCSCTRSAKSWTRGCAIPGSGSGSRGRRGVSRRRLNGAATSRSTRMTRGAAAVRSSWETA